MSDRASPLVRLEAVTRRFGARIVLKGIDLDLWSGETLVVLGQSGSGKSVLLKHLNGLLRPDSGSVTVLERDVGRLGEAQLVDLRRKVSYIFQMGALFDSLSVGENVAFPLREHTTLGESEIAARVAAMLARVGLAGTERLTTAELSGGMRKRVALARGLVLEPEVILYDEPTAGLDPLTGLAITSLIREISQGRKTASLVVTHDLAVARELGGCVAFLHDGRLAFRGALAEAARSEGLVGEFVRAGGIHD